MGLFLGRRPAYNVFMRLLIFICILLLNVTQALAWTGEVVGVHDGDSITVRRADTGKTAKVRMPPPDPQAPCPGKGLFVS